jgi:hypothetical protein
VYATDINDDALKTLDGIKGIARERTSSTLRPTYCGLLPESGCTPHNNICEGIISISFNAILCPLGIIPYKLNVLDKGAIEEFVAKVLYDDSPRYREDVRKIQHPLINPSG